RKHRAKKKLPMPQPRPEPKPVSVTVPDVTESPKRTTQSPEISAEERQAQNEALDQSDELTPGHQRHLRSLATEACQLAERFARSRRINYGVLSKETIEEVSRVIKAWRAILDGDRSKFTGEAA